RSYLLKRALHIEVTGFYFKLNNALVQRKDGSGADYYINAGDTKQKGLEVSADYNKHFPGSAILRSLQIRGGYTLHDFTYGTLLKDTVNFSGKQLPGVPKNAVSIAADLNLTMGAYVNLTWYQAGETFLNDANSAKTKGYNLLGARIGFRFSYGKWMLNFYGGGDNLLDEKYSLGNDINDPRGRFFNAAALRNYYAGVRIGHLCKQ
ncbi:MAG TPA: TonB-dependent receptor, partial [Flavitalea sp.]|nr:TonB-dependent receptor [Flavitalea sp.]